MDKQKTLPGLKNSSDKKSNFSITEFLKNGPITKQTSLRTIFRI